MAEMIPFEKLPWINREFETGPVSRVSLYPQRKMMAFDEAGKAGSDTVSKQKNAERHGSSESVASP